MSSRITDTGELIDRKTSRAIFDAVGETLKQKFRLDCEPPSSRLQHLMDELRRRDHDNPRLSSN